ncbi:MAG TPA: SRPBCC family protein [Ktedonosporobacter sp.]|nr:SRPBCC family protein [Ktedonosporobacter sp.]
MPTIRLETYIHAPVERCFDLSLSIDLHQGSMAKTRERAVAGVTSGLLKLNDTVTWEATHFGVRQRLTTKITEYERPVRFVDEMLQGAFKEIRHVHEFLPQHDGTLMIDIMAFQSPLGVLGWLADSLVLERYMLKLLLARNQHIKNVAESSQQEAAT